MTDHWNDDEHLPRSEALRRACPLKTPAQRRAEARRRTIGIALPWIAVSVAGVLVGGGGVLAATKLQTAGKVLGYELREDQRRQAEQSHVHNANMRSFWSERRAER
ncbi:hypothetical protein [Salinarimonas soli]|uniref:Uncharacterized protein n=1 Tax=Salinarimonas soli TaxID=1638099 RepID=A0A5B2VIK4_9HYPH|nr:hypothetical protein [Salinarimonas soli]KAA2238192.1 hypothetical protein F0L46_05960 [Salinarimonas soli]